VGPASTITMMSAACSSGKRIGCGGFPGGTWPLGQVAWLDEQAPFLPCLFRRAASFAFLPTGWSDDKFRVADHQGVITPR
jgi:hypothetical protein